MRGQTRQAGLTIVEVMVAAAILIIVLGLSAAIISALGNTRTTQQTSTGVNLAQQGAEFVRGKWQDPTMYAARCFNPSGTTLANAEGLPSGVRISGLADLDIFGTVNPNQTSFALVCPATLNATNSNNPPLRRVTITSTSGAEPRTIVVEVGRP